MTRRAIAAIILLVWLAGLGVLARRELRKTDWDRLVEAAVRVDPAAYYYRVYQGDTQVGVASSVIDTSHGQMRTTDFFHGRLTMDGDTRTVEGSAVAYLSRRLALDSFAIVVDGGRTPIRLRGAPKDQVAPVFLPGFAPVAFMLTGDPKVGRAASSWVYNPLVRDVQHVTLRVLAESLVTVSDSAKFDSTAARWVSAHTDTVRAWSITPRTLGLTVWVDAQGRIVRASTSGGWRVERTAYEEAFSNWRNASSYAHHQ